MSGSKFKQKITSRFAGSIPFVLGVSLGMLLLPVRAREVSRIRALQYATPSSATARIHHAIDQTRLGASFHTPALFLDWIQSENSVLDWNERQELFKKNHVRITHSLASSPSSVHTPRRIGVSDSGDFAIAYQENAQTVEMIQLDRGRNHYVFSEVFFSPEKGARIKVHGDSPSSSCFKCHEGRPNWDPTFPRPGVAVEDQTGPAEQVSRAFARSNAIRIASILRNTPEWPALGYFLAAAVLDCPDLEDFELRPDLKARLSLDRFEWRTRIRSAMKRDLIERLNSSRVDRSASIQESLVAPSANLLWINQAVTILSAYDGPEFWSLGFSRRRGGEPYPIDFLAAGGQEELARVLVAQLDDPSSGGAPAYERASCEWLEEQNNLNYMRKTPNFVSTRGALREVDNPNAIASRVFQGKRIPSSQSRPVE
jgi:hypothetical protein